MRNYPFARSDLPAATTAQALAIDIEVTRLLDVHDAVADLALAEGVHEAVLGNFDRVASTLDAYGRGGFPPEPAVIATPRSGTGLTHRFAIHLRTGLDPFASPVEGVAMTPRAVAAAAVNDLLARMLPPPGDIVAQVTWVSRDGASQLAVVSQADIELQPIDLMHLLRLGSQEMAELDERILRFVETENALAPDVASGLTIVYTERVPGRTSFFEVAPLVAELRSLVTRSRPLRPTDLMPGNEARSVVDHTGIRADAAPPTAVRDALGQLRASAEGFLEDLDALLADPTGNRATLLSGIDDFLDSTIDLLSAVGRFGLPNCGWGGLTDNREALLAQLLGLVDDLVARWTRRLADADAQLAADLALPVTATDEERNRLLLLADRALSTVRTAPLPGVADDYAAIIQGKRDAFSQRLEDFAAVRPVADTLSGALAAVTALLPIGGFDASPFDLTPVQDGVIALAGDLRARVAATVAETAQRVTAAGERLAEHDAATPGPARVAGVVAATKSLLGDDAVVVPEFDLPAELGDELQAAIAWSRTGQLTEHLAATRPLAVEDWLHGLARVREKLHAWEQAALLASALGRPEPELLPIQIPHAGEPWLALELPDGFAIESDRLLYTAYYPAAFDKRVAQCALLVDEWVETIPGDSETTGIAFHHDSPDCEAPQAMLLVVPPEPTEGWLWTDIVDTLNETLDFARTRAVEPAQVDATTWASFLPATVSAATVSGISIAVNLAVNNGLLDQLKANDA